MLSLVDYDDCCHLILTRVFCKSNYQQNGQDMCPPGPPLDIFWFNEYSHNFELGRREKEKNPESSFQCKHHETCV